MKTHKTLSLTIVIILAILFTQLGLPATLGGPTPVYAADGLAQLKIVSQYPIKSLTVTGANQNNDPAIWEHDYGNNSTVMEVPIDNWWWRFKWYCPWWLVGCKESDFSPPDTISPYVWVRYTNGFLEHKRCVPSTISKDTNWVVCDFTYSYKGRIGIEAGHGVNGDPGAHNNGKEEQWITLEVAQRAAKILRGLGYEVDVFRGNVEGTLPKSQITGYQSDAFIALHVDWAAPNQSGFKVSRYGGKPVTGKNGSGDASDRLVDALWSTYGKATGLPEDHSSGHFTADMLYYYPLNPSGGISPVTPGAIIEMGWLSGDFDLITSPEGHHKMAQGIAEAIHQFKSGNPIPKASTIFHVAPGASVTFQVAVLPGLAHATFSTNWPGSDVVMSLITPSGRVINRTVIASDIVHDLGATFEKYTVLNPEAGNWDVSLFGADVVPEGEDVAFEFTTSLEAPPPPPQLAYLDGSTLVLNMGSEERRQARIIEPDEINEEFTVKQIDANTFSVTAFGLTQVYAGATRIKADGDDGNDVITLVSGEVPFTAPAEITGGSGDDQIQSGDGVDTLSGGAGTDKINAGGGADTLNGDEGDDDLNGGGGNDTLAGGAGADVLHGGEDNDKLSGEAGSDKLYGDAGNDTIEGGADNDYLEGNDGADTLRGGDGDDELYGQANADEIYGDAGNDKLYGGTGDDRMEGGAGTDYLEGNDDADVMRGGDEDDKLYGNAGADEMYGDDGRDTMYGNAGNDVMHGGMGNDHMEGNEDADTMYGDDGQDMMYGNTGNDMMHGSAGEDRMEGNEDADTMYGDDDQDTMYGNTGNDAMHGGAGDDYMEGNEDADTMYGDEGQDDMIGGTPTAGTSDGQDTISGGPDHDVIIGDNGSITRPGGVNIYNGSVQRDVVLYDVQVVGGPSISAGVSGDDRISGDDGDDVLFGQGGNDTMSGGAGSDYLEGNAGADVMNGDASQDDMIGGGSANDGVIDADRRGDGLVDMGDEVHGGDASDVMTGDNAQITRPVNGTGHWLIDPNTNEPIRQIVLFDVEAVGGAAVNPVTSGSDRMFGDAGGDKLFGQGNGTASDTVGSDPKDNVDNDRNGRENGNPAGAFDCLDGRDNDSDGLIDMADPQCAAAIDNATGGDEMHGGPGVDYLEGNHGSDWMFGDDGEDDMLGGNSAGDGVIGGPVPPTGLRDGNDVMNGNAEDDVLIGDNGQIIHPSDANGLHKWLAGGVFDLAIRDVTMAQTPEPVGAYGNDWLSGGDGVDDIYGQLGNDYLEGNADADAMIGDLGKITNNLIGVNDGLPDPGIEQYIAPNAPFFDPGELVYQNGSLFRQVELYTFVSGGGGAGNDTMYGGNGNDRIHSGPGADIVNGNTGDDVIYTGDDSDAAWGGPGHDILFGGYGIDYLDVLPRPARADKKDNFPEDPATWFEAAKVDDYQGLDIMYGGWDRDWMQADVSAPGRVNGDRMIDWAGSFNAYYRCDAAYGDWVITRQHSPSLVAFLKALAQGHGAVNTATAGTSGFRETAIVFSQEIKDNANPPNPDNPAHFTCGPAQ